MMPLSIFGFRALWSPWFLLIILIGIALYIFLATKMRHRFEGTESLTRKQFLLFLLSMVLLYAVKGSPVDLMGHILFTMHMVQMALLLLLVAPLLIIGIPNWMWKKVFDIKILARIIGVLTKPVISLIIFIGMFSIYHIPIILDSVKLSAPLHTIFTITLFLAAMLFWWPVINTLEGQPKLHGLKKLVILF